MLQISNVLCSICYDSGAQHNMPVPLTDALLAAVVSLDSYLLARYTHQVL